MLVEKINEMIETLTATKTDAEKFEKGNNAAGTRVRKAMQEIKTKAQEVRIAVSEAKNSETK